MTTTTSSTSSPTLPYLIYNRDGLNEFAVDANAKGGLERKQINFMMNSIRALIIDPCR
ncbi:hypothetical protein DFA_02042 [Cavenderia fasciculata]|uniref:Uncharacterized protein n=1 Tax=Cavenderia fasciculata TaxID=261658 RepID=F4PYJ0_CACFS|nr:uncharacterized protein DFA_02042 [Cavenderia fasciculata]EGG19256.1 hypothetical protein DFA_02042 [Cavenderia fasciculata]|eukprot:XP_004357527.1 hypothetical protein DFA_02042 [Cavenderia fasciculata]